MLTTDLIHSPLGDSRQQRFWALVNKSGPVPAWRPDLGPCWLWAGVLNKGYGQFGRCLAAHRVSYEILVGPIPTGHDVDHLCRVTACVNPSHLEPVTHAENIRRGLWGMTSQARSNVSHCPAGHPYSAENTRIGKDGRRRCVSCRIEISRRWRRRNGAPPQRVISAAEKQTAIDLVKGGASLAVAGKAVGVTKKAVWNWIRQEAGMPC